MRSTARKWLYSVSQGQGSGFVAEAEGKDEGKDEGDDEGEDVRVVRQEGKKAKL